MYRADAAMVGHFLGDGESKIARCKIFRNPQQNIAFLQVSRTGSAACGIFSAGFALCAPEHRVARASGLVLTLELAAQQH